MTRVASKRKTLLRLLGEVGLRDFKGKEEMHLAKVLYDAMAKNDQEESKAPELALDKAKIENPNGK